MFEPITSNPTTPHEETQVAELSPTCPLCHTLDPTLTSDSLHAGAEWTCTRCSQTWSAARLATVAAYDQYESTPTLPGYRPWVAIALVSLHMAAVGACASPAYVTASQANRDIEALTDFRLRVDRYIDLHDALQEEGHPPTQTEDVGQTRALQQALATRIRAARPNARQGDVFTPPVAAMLRTAMNPQLRGAAAAGTRASIRDDAPARFALQVNGLYPDGASLPTVPPNVLEILPLLPEVLEYRIVDTHLILRDVDAGIVVDYLLDVMCARC